MLQVFKKRFFAPNAAKRERIKKTERDAILEELSREGKLNAENLAERLHKPGEAKEVALNRARVMLHRYEQTAHKRRFTKSVAEMTKHLIIDDEDAPADLSYNKAYLEGLGK